MSKWLQKLLGGKILSEWFQKVLPSFVDLYYKIEEFEGWAFFTCWKLVSTRDLCARFRDLMRFWIEFFARKLALTFGFGWVGSHTNPIQTGGSNRILLPRLNATMHRTNLSSVRSQNRIQKPRAKTVLSNYDGFMQPNDRWRLKSGAFNSGISRWPTLQHHRKGTARGLSAPSLTRGLWNSLPGLECIDAQHCSQ